MAATYDLMQHFMNDELSLRSYLMNKEVDGKQLAANLMACAHKNRAEIPDQYYNGWNKIGLQEANVQEYSDLKTIFSKLLPTFANKFLCMQGEKICVKNGMWNNWQLICREFSPLVLKAIFLYNELQRNGRLDIEAILEKNFKYTALPYIQGDFINDIKPDFYDDHVHAGSSLEGDIVWIDFLYDCKFFIENEDNKDVAINTLVKSRKELYDLSCIAVSLINAIRNVINGDLKCRDINDAFTKITTDNKKIQRNIINSWVEKGQHPLCEEASFLIKALKRIGNNSYLALYLHYYLLIMGFVRQYLVVQSSQKGLDQFNLTLHAPFRGKTADYIDNSIAQMAGNDLQGVKNIELRINPNGGKMLEPIGHALDNLRKMQGDGNKTKISLVCHFIKGEKVNNKTLDEDVNAISPFLGYLVGIDVAGRDFLSSPDVFARAINRIRKDSQGKKLHFTYHAGEDFFHILDGLRTIFEVLQFLNYDNGDRIGHASAAGVSPTLWAANLNGILPISQGMYLDDLVFAVYLIEKRHIVALNGKVQTLKEEINNLSREVYGTSRTYEELRDSWLKRGKQEYKKEGNYSKFISIGCFETLTAEDLVILQQEIMMILAEKNIAVEACPTSNVTIGHHHTFESYHLKTWLKWKQEGKPIPTIVLGSDETGVFPTNIAIEYANIYDMLNNDKVTNASEIVKQIVHDSQDRAFKK